MTIDFSCENCRSPFSVDEKLAGRAGRCKKCGRRFIIPAPAKAAKREPALAGAARISAARDGNAGTRSTGWLNALTSQVALKPVTADALRPVRNPARPASTGAKRDGGSPRDRGWLDAVNSNVALKPITIEKASAVGRRDEVEMDSGPYRLTARPKESRRVSSRPANVITVGYRGVFRTIGKILRWINETAYGISVLCLIAALVGCALQAVANFRGPPPDPLLVSNNPQVRRNVAVAEAVAEANQPPAKQHSARSFKPHPLTSFGIAGIVILNVIRLATGLANLVVIPFRKSPQQGVMFLIPPLTFVYIWNHWNKVRKPVGRVVGPMATLALVVALYMFVPGFSHGGKSHRSLETQIQGAVQDIRKDVQREVKKTGNRVDDLKKDLPGQLNKAQKAVGDFKDKVEKSVDELKTSAQGEPGDPQATPPNSEKRRP